MHSAHQKPVSGLRRNAVGSTHKYEEMLLQLLVLVETMYPRAGVCTLQNWACYSLYRLTPPAWAWDCRKKRLREKPYLEFSLVARKIHLRTCQAFLMTTILMKIRMPCT